MTIEGEILPSISIDIPAGVTGNSSAGVTVVITPSSTYQTEAQTNSTTESFAPFVDITSVSDSGNAS